MHRIKVLLADDHAVLRAGLRALIDGQTDMAVVAEAADGADAVRLAEAVRPDIVLMDISMPKLGGIEAIPRVRERSPASRVLVLTMHDDPAYARTALAAGAAGHVVKHAEAAELLEAIRAVYQGRTFVDVAEGHGALAAPGVERGQPRDGGPALSERERQVLALVARGYTNQEVAIRLGLSVKTVESYRSRLTDKLGLRSRAELVSLALELGLIRPLAPE